MYNGILIHVTVFELIKFVALFVLIATLPCLIGILCHEAVHYAIVRFAANRSNIDVKLLSLRPHVMATKPSEVIDLHWRLYCGGPFLIGSAIAGVFVLNFNSFSLYSVTIIGFIIGLATPSGADLFGLLRPKESKEFIIKNMRPPSNFEVIKQI